MAKKVLLAGWTALVLFLAVLTQSAAADITDYAVFANSLVFAQGASEVNGSVGSNGNVFLSGGVNVNGNVASGGDFFAGGSQTTINGNVVSGGGVYVGPGTMVTGSLTASGTGTVDGTVLGSTAMSVAPSPFTPVAMPTPATFSAGGDPVTSGGTLALGVTATSHCRHRVP